MTMTFGRMSEPLTKVQKVDSTKTAQSYDFTYKYEDSNHPTAPTQIGHEHYTYDANGNPTLVENDSLNTERRMYWDEDNRLMVYRTMARRADIPTMPAANVSSRATATSKAYISTVRHRESRSTKRKITRFILLR